MTTTLIFSSIPHKRCYKCGETKPISEFNKDRSKKDGYHGRCKTCHQLAKQNRIDSDPVKRSKVSATRKAYSKAQNSAKVEYVRTLKETTACVDCGYTGPYYCLDFDHVTDVKNFEIGSALQNTRITLDMLRAEIDLCELVCAICHRIRTHNRGYLDPEKPTCKG